MQAAPTGNARPAHMPFRSVQTRGHRVEKDTSGPLGNPSSILPVQDCQMNTIRVRLRDRAGSVVATIDVTADMQRVEHEGRWYRRGGGGSAVGPDPLLLSYHEEPDDE